MRLAAHGRDRHSSGPCIAARLGATYPHAPRAESSRAYGVLLRVEIARFTRCAFVPEGPASHRLVSVALILTSRWTAVGCYAALCSPDLPPVRPFEPCTSGGLACFTARIIDGHAECGIGATNRPAGAVAYCPIWGFVNRRPDPAF